MEKHKAWQRKTRWQGKSGVSDWLLRPTGKKGALETLEHIAPTTSVKLKISAPNSPSQDRYTHLTRNSYRLKGLVEYTSSEEAPTKQDRRSKGKLRPYQRRQTLRNSTLGNLLPRSQRIRRRPQWAPQRRAHTSLKNQLATTHAKASSSMQVED